MVLNFRLSMLMGMFLLVNSPLIAQLPELTGKTLGIYISAKQVNFNEDYHMDVNQFLTVEEDRSWGVNAKTEFLVRLGERLGEQLKEVTGLDSVYFLNADPARAREFIQQYNPDNGIVRPLSNRFEGTDMILIIDELTLLTRSGEYAYIRSNRIFTQRIRVKHAQLSMRWHNLEVNDHPLRTVTCFDAKESTRPPHIINLYAKDSSLGDFLTKLFSTWWLQMAHQEPNNCQDK